MAKRNPGLVGALALVCLLPCAANAQPATETIVLLRHGEKPPGGLGQLDCQGLNRALALPHVLKRFGTPEMILAPDPGVGKRDGATSYAYVRPLATIEPTAVALGMPVNASLGYGDISGLRRVIDDPVHRRGLLLVSWEHHVIVDLLRLLSKEYGGPPIPDWPAGEFDRLDVVRLVRDGAATHMTLDVQQQGLNNLPTTCPSG